ncbi:TonB-dependent receptor [Brucepastera parasyntrophica]|uniref:TonB-dependent receptor n=1 Tax=Brucepastera parasyntrophica TaxID=2880008 RepID=UPI00210EC244|nr:TonB-dependent receptor [Brucepastera parasyntrophica]ULQ59206.1 TonB-dependent receptor [Brucepastera parasyntrophica]
MQRFFILFLFCCSMLAAETIPSYVVTANRTEEEIIEVPAGVTVITSQQIKESGKTSMVQVLRDLGGLTFHSYSGVESSAQVSMRGFSENSFGRVSVYVDGRKLNNPDMNGLNWLAIPVSSIDRIEILDGPAGVIYGSGAVGGVIYITTKENTGGAAASALVSMGSFDSHRLQLGGGYGTDTAGFFISADVFHTAGSRERTETTNIYAGANGFFDIADICTIRPSFSYYNQQYQMPGPLTADQYENNPSMAVNQDDAGKETGLTGQVTAAFYLFDTVQIDIPASYTLKKTSADMVSWFSFSDRVYHLFDIKPKAEYSREIKTGSMRLSGGLDFEGAILTAESFADPGRTNSSFEFSISQFTLAPFISAAVPLPFNLILGAGVRYSFSAVNAYKDKPVIGQDAFWNPIYGDEIDESDFYHSFVYDISLTYRFLRNCSVYITYSTLFRIPFVDEKAELTGYGIDRFNADLRPEHGWNAGAGFKYIVNPFLSVGLNVYYMSISDEIVYASSNVNLDETRRIGGDIKIHFAPLNQVEVSGGAGYVNAVVVDGSYTDYEIPMVPAFTGNMQVLLRLPLGFTLSSDISYTGTRYYKDSWSNIDEKIDPYLLWGMYMSFSPDFMTKRLALSLRIDNILDTKYAEYCATDYNSMPAAVAYYPGSRRSFTLSVSFAY